MSEWLIDYLIDWLIDIDVIIVLFLFKKKKKEYLKEEIVWDQVDFNDNQDCIELVESRMGVFSLLDEECRCVCMCVCMM